MIRLMIVDDHPMVRRSLAELFDAEPDIEVVGALGDGDAAVEVASTAKPDVVLMDISMPGMGGIEATRKIMAAHPEARVVMLTSHSDREHVIDSLDNGAVGYLLKDAETDELLRSVRAAARGESPLSPKAARALIDSRQDQRPASELTARERDVLRLLVRGGLSNKQIAWRLGISEKTVKAHLTSVFQRIGVEDRTQAALWAQRNNIV
jgi:DNA-binding NarL/FixJ family response regulator